MNPFAIFVGTASLASLAVGLALGLGVLAGVLSGRKRRRTAWRGFFARTAIAASILVAAVYCAGALYAVRSAGAAPPPGTVTVTTGMTTHRVGVEDLIATSILAGLASGGLALLVRKLVASRRLPPGHCATCGYNLTGAPHQRCPECGEAIQSSPIKT